MTQTSRKIPIKFTYKLPASVLVTGSGLRYLCEGVSGRYTSDHIKTLAEQRGMSVAVINNHIKKLKECGYIREFKEGEKERFQVVGAMASRKKLRGDQNDRVYGQSFIYDPIELLNPDLRLKQVKAIIAKEQIRVVSCLIIGKKRQAERWAEMLAKDKRPKRCIRGEHQEIPLEEVERTINIFQNNTFLTNSQIDALQSGTIRFNNLDEAERAWVAMNTHLTECESKVEKIEGSDTKGPIGPILLKLKSGHHSKEEVTLAFDKNDDEIEKFTSLNSAFFRSFLVDCWDGENYSYDYEHGEGVKRIVLGFRLGTEFKPLEDHRISDEELFMVIHRFFKDLKNASAGKAYVHKYLGDKRPENFEHHRFMSELAWNREERKREKIRTEERLWSLFEEFKSIHAKRRPFKKCQVLWNKGKENAGVYELVRDGERYLVDLPVISDKAEAEAFIGNFESLLRKEETMYRHTHTIRVTAAHQPLATSLGISQKTLGRRLKDIKEMGLGMGIQRNEVCLGDYSHKANRAYNSADRTGGIAGYNRATYRTKKHVRENGIPNLGMTLNESPDFLDLDPGGNKLQMVLSLPNTYEFVREKISKKPDVASKMVQTAFFEEERKINLCVKSEEDEGKVRYGWSRDKTYTEEQMRAYKEKGEEWAALKEYRKRPAKSKEPEKAEVLVPFSEPDPRDQERPYTSWMSKKMGIKQF